MLPPDDASYIYTAAEVGAMLGIAAATVRKYASLEGQQGHELGRVFRKPGGGWVRRYSEADLSWLRTKSAGSVGWPKGRSRKAVA